MPPTTIKSQERRWGEFPITPSLPGGICFSHKPVHSVVSAVDIGVLVAVVILQRRHNRNGAPEKMFRRFVPLLVAFLVLSTVFFALVQAQDAPAGPSIPEFTLQTQIDANVTTITLTIQNQSFDATSYPNDGFFYNVRMRIGDGNWSELYTAEDWYPEQSNESTTTITYTTGETAYLQQETSQGHPVIPTSGTVEFEVQAMIGHRDRGDLIPGTMIMPYVFVGVVSDWSSPQTVNLNPATLTPTITATALPSGKPDASSWVLLGLLVALVAGLMAAAVILKRRGQKSEVMQKP